MQENKDGSVTYNQDDIKAMPPEQINEVFAGKVKIEGTGVVRGADGQIKYDADATPGEYGEDTND